jgi:uncharacterized membrane protein
MVSAMCVSSAMRSASLFNTASAPSVLPLAKSEQWLCCRRFTTWAGGLFAAFSFAISVFSIPMLLDEPTDAFTAMGMSISRVWNNRPVMIAWGVIVLALTAIGLLTAMIGLIVVFPLLGHATWHAYKAIK